MKQKAFTLSEVLLAMAIIGILATAAANTLSNIGADKTKVAFKNCYNHMVQTIDSIASDETKCPRLLYEDNSGNTKINSQGRQTQRPLRESCVYMDEDGNITENDARTFTFHFSDATQSISTETTYYRLGYGSNYMAPGGVSIEAKNGSYWEIFHNKNTAYSGTITNVNDSDYLIYFDVNGIGTGTDCPYNLNSVVQQDISGANCSEPDTFLFGLTYDTQILPDTNNYYNGSNLKTYMTNKHLIETDF